MIKTRERAVAYVILTFFALITLYPMVGVIIVALTPQSSILSGFHFPWPPTLSNFSGAWGTGQFGLYLRSSAIITVSVVVASGAISVLAGYAFGTMTFRGSQLLFYFMLLGLILPSEATIIPLYFDMRNLGLTDTYWSVILPDIGASTAFGTFWMRAFFMTAPTSLMEAARIDGASTLKVLWHILIPIGRPAIMTMAVLTFVWTWNDFLLPLVMLQSPDLATAPLGISLFIQQYTSQQQELAAASMIVAAPVVLVYLFAQRHFIRGMLSGAMTG